MRFRLVCVGMVLLASACGDASSAGQSSENLDVPTSYSGENSVEFVFQRDQPSAWIRDSSEVGVPVGCTMLTDTNFVVEYYESGTVETGERAAIHSLRLAVTLPGSVDSPREATGTVRFQSRLAEGVSLSLQDTACAIANLELSPEGYPLRGIATCGDRHASSGGLSVEFSCGSISM